MSHIDVSYTAVCAVRNAASSTDRVAVFFVTPLSERQQQRELMLRIREQVTRRVGINVDFFLPVTQEDIPKTAIGKIQRALLRERFQQGDFDAVLKQVDIILNEQTRTLPDWFCQATWVQRKGREQGYTLPTTPTLLFLDRGGLGAHLREELSAPCICVEQGADFARLDASRYSINPTLPEHYHRLLVCLRDEGQAIGQILHLWTYGEEKNGAPEDLEALQKVQYKGAYSLLFLVQAFAALPPTGRIIHCYVVSSAMHTLTPESTWNPAAAPLRGFLKTISLELPWFQCHSIDLESACIEQNSANILSECSLPSRRENEVAYRGQKRFVMALQRVRLAKRPAASSPLKERGIYLVTGGLGGIGTLLISYLIEHLRARVVAVGRTSLPERDAWPDHLASESTLARRIRHYQALEASGGEFFYRSVDITDVAGLRRVIAEAEERWQEPLSGVFHLAGEGNLAYHWEVAEEHRVASETLETFESMFRPKVYGTWALSQALKEHPQIPFIAFSSVNSLFGGASFSAYSAANSFLDAFLHARYQQGQEATYCLNWSLWDNIGMSEGNPAYASDAAHTQGYVTIAQNRGLASLLAILAHEAHFTVIGLDRSSPHIQRYLHTDPRQMQQIQAYFTTHGEALPLAKLQSLEVKDRFQAASRCYFQQLAHLPSTPTGEIDLEQLRGSLAKNQHTPQANALPVTELEHTIAAIWQEVLGLETVSIYDNFFSLGGHSLRMSQVHSKLQSALKQTLSMVDLFKYPTIQTLAQFLSQGEQDEEVFAESYARADIRRERYQRRARHMRRELQEK